MPLPPNTQTEVNHIRQFLLFSRKQYLKILTKHLIYYCTWTFKLAQFVVFFSLNLQLSLCFGSKFFLIVIVHMGFMSFPLFCNSKEPSLNFISPFPHLIAPAHNIFSLLYQLLHTQKLGTWRKSYFRRKRLKFRTRVKFRSK